MAALSSISKHILFSLIILIVGCAVYSNTFSVPFMLDDEKNIVNNAFIKDPEYIRDMLMLKESALRASGQRAIGFFTFGLNYRLHGLDVAGYHALNLLIHLATGLLVYRLVILLCRTSWFRATHGAAEEHGGKEFAAFAAGLLFVCHPVQTQAVTYVVQRFASLAALWFVLSVTLYLSWRLSERSSPAGSLVYGAALLAAVLGMKTKETVFTLPLVIIGAEFMFMAGDRRKRLLPLLPFILTMLIIPLALVGPSGSFSSVQDIDKAASSAGLPEISRHDYLATQFRVLVTYVRLLLFPINQNLDYDYPVQRSLLETPVIASLAVLAVCLALAFMALRRSRMQGEGQGYYRLIAFGAFWFFVTLSVESGVIPIADVIFEHRLYLPAAGVFVSAGASLALLRKKVTRAGTALAAGLAIASICLSLATFARNSTWSSDIAMWEDVVRKSPGKARAHYNLGVFYGNQGRYRDAIRECEQAALLAPGDPEIRFHLNFLYQARDASR